MSGAAAGSSSSIERDRPRDRPRPRRRARGRPRDASRHVSRRQQLARDHEPLDLARALADGRELDVAEELLRRVVLDEPVAAVNLHAVLGGAHRDLAGEQLGHRRLERHAPALILQPGRAIGQQPRRFDAGGVVDQLPANRLERADRRAELLPLEGVAARRLVGALGQADGQRGDADAAGVEHLQRLDEPLPFVADQLIGRARGTARGSPRWSRWRASRACLPSCRRAGPACRARRRTPRCPWCPGSCR